MSEKEGKERIRSTTNFLWEMLIELLKIPFILILVVFGKRSVNELFKPLAEIYRFIIEAKFTLSLIVLNVLIFFFIAGLAQGLLDFFVQYPSDLFSLRVYTLITAGFMHSSWSHLLGNMLGIFILGRICEQKLGSAKTALVYFGALIISGVFTSLINFFLLNDNTPGLGASGALMGLVATAVLISPFSISYEAIIPLPVMFLGWIALWADITGIINPVEDGIGHFAHLGGFLSIALLAFLLGVDERKKMWKGLIINLISLAIVLALYFFFLKPSGLEF